jgi:DNA-binding response OmpR family regulator
MACASAAHALTLRSRASGTAASGYAPRTAAEADVVKRTAETLASWGGDGLRTLVFAQKRISREDLASWAARYDAACTDLDELRKRKDKRPNAIEDLQTTIESGRVVVDRTRHIALVDGAVVELTAKEFDLLAVLAEEPGRAVTRQELFSRVWDPVWIGTGKTLDVHVASLRKKLGDPALIETVRGVGYRLAETGA